MDLVRPGTKIEVVRDRRLVKIPVKGPKVQTGTNNELPDEPKVVNPIALLLCYDLFGLTELAIVHAMGLTEDQIAEIRETSTYDTLKEGIISRFKSSETDEIRGLFKAEAKKAAQKLIEQLDSNSSSQALSAAMKVLDFAGLSPKQGRSVDDRMTTGLNIIFMDKPEEKVIENGD